MKNAWATYFVLRIGLFAGVLAIFLLIGLDPFAAALFAAAVSLALSLLFFSRQRNAMADALTKSIEKRRKFGQADTDSDIENELLDEVKGKDAD